MYNQVIIEIFLLSGVLGLIFCVLATVVNWQIKYELNKKPSDILKRRLVFFIFLFACLALLLFYWVDELIKRAISLYNIPPNREIIINSNFIWYVLFGTVTYIVFYLIFSIVAKKFLGQKKLFTVFRSNNRIFGIF